MNIDLHYSMFLFKLMLKIMVLFLLKKNLHYSMFLFKLYKDKTHDSLRFIYITVCFYLNKAPMFISFIIFLFTLQYVSI
mgnify:CR=1 FL=1